MEGKTAVWIDWSGAGMPFRRFDIESRELDVAAVERFDRAISVVIDRRVENLPPVEIAIR